MEGFVLIVGCICFIIVVVYFCLIDINKPVKEFVKAYQTNPKRFRFTRQEDYFGGVRGTLLDASTVEIFHVSVNRLSKLIYVSGDLRLSTDEQNYLYNKIAKPMYKRHMKKLRLKASRRDRDERNRLRNLYK